MAYINKKIRLQDYENVLDALDYPIFSIDIEGKFVFANKAFIASTPGKKNLNDEYLQNIFKIECSNKDWNGIIEPTKLNGAQFHLKANESQIDEYIFIAYRCHTHNFNEILFFFPLNEASEIIIEKHQIEQYLRTIVNLSSINTDYEDSLIIKSLANISELIKLNTNIKFTLSQIAKRICVSLGGSGSIVWVKSEDKIYACGQYGLKGSYVDSGLLNLPIHKGIIGTNINEIEPKIYNNFREHPLLYHKDFPRNENLYDMILIPMVYKKKSIGMIGVFFSANIISDSTAQSIISSFGTFSASVVNSVLLLEAFRELKDEYHAMILKTFDSTKKAFFKPLAGMINHEVKNIVNIMKSQIDEMLTDNKLLSKLSNAKRKELIKLQSKLNQGAKLTKDLSELFIYEDEKDISKFKIQDAIYKAVSFCSPKIDTNNIKIDLESIDSNLELKGNKIEFLIIIFNLITNSINAIIKTGKNVYPKGSIVISAKTIGKSIEISIKDDGVGISNETLKHIFIPGFTTNIEKDSKSSGIGLYGVREILKEEYNGTISITSSLGKGANVLISIPLVRGGN